MARSKLLDLTTLALLALASCSRSPAPSNRIEALRIDDADVIEMYAERVRLGLGSPFRTVELMLRDPRVKDHTRTGNQLLDQMRRREMYQLSPIALRPVAASEVSAITQFELVRDAVLGAQDPRVGEAAVNIVYERARVHEGLRERIAGLSALYRDYALAYRDVQRLSDAARREKVMPTNLLIRWRSERKFLVDQPTLVPLDAKQRADAETYADLIDGGISIAIGARDGTLTRRIGISEIDSAARLESAFDTAVALRTFAQQDLAPDSVTSGRLKTVFGVNVRFDKKVTAENRNRTLADLWSALSDLHLIMPTVNFAGLTFDVRAIREGARYQAYHDAATRTIRIDPVKHAGTLAHELGHDVDWQEAKRSFGRKTAYASDLTVVPSSADRPTEAYARRFEWRVATALAKLGRSNSQLSSVQNDWLRGHGWAIKPEPVKVYGPAARQYNLLDKNAYNLWEVARPNH